MYSKLFLFSYLSFFYLTLLFSFKPPLGYLKHPEGGCAWQIDENNFNPIEHIITIPPYLKTNITQYISNLPLNFSWDSSINNGSSLVTSVRNQLLPNPCGSCWAISSVGALSDRIKIEIYKKKNIISTDINLSPQYLLDICFDNEEYVCGSCNGGSANLAYNIIYQTSISDESCNPYLGREVSLWSEISPINYICRNCYVVANELENNGCKLIPPNPKLNFSINEFGVLNYKNFLPYNNNATITMVEAMQQEIYERGSIVCDMYAHGVSFENYTGGYILIDDNKYQGTTHDLTLIGFGINNDGILYWVGRNSFGTIWGNNGFFLAQRGTNIYNMEQTCYWATPKFPDNFFD